VLTALSGPPSQYECLTGLPVLWVRCQALDDASVRAARAALHAPQARVVGGRPPSCNSGRNRHTTYTRIRSRTQPRTVQPVSPRPTLQQRRSRRGLVGCPKGTQGEAGCGLVGWDHTHDAAHTHVSAARQPDAGTQPHPVCISRRSLLRGQGARCCLCKPCTSAAPCPTCMQFGQERRGAPWAASVDGGRPCALSFRQHCCTSANASPATQRQTPQRSALPRALRSPQ
jgi:hypothetical protein